MTFKARDLRLLAQLLKPQARRDFSQLFAASAHSHPISPNIALSSARRTTKYNASNLFCAPYSTSSTATPSPVSSSSSSNSVSPSEVNHFSRLASTWWDPHGPSRLLHLMNPLRHQFISSLNASSPAPPSSLNILDIGTGAGIFAESAARLRQTSSVLAIDPTPSLIDAARAHLRCDPSLSSSGKLHYECCGVEDLPSSSETGGKYNLITLFEVLEHITHPSPFLHTVSRHLAPGGWLVGSTISRSALSYVTTKLIAEAPWPIGVVPRGTHDWAQYIRPEELGGWFAKQSLGKEEKWGEMVTRGCVYLPGLRWRWVEGSEGWGNYFWGVQKLPE
ncbi:MAG: hypothetical protein Q9160_001966 [Pyrenula sp. 1 TL-2023]